MSTKVSALVSFLFLVLVLGFDWFEYEFQSEFLFKIEKSILCLFFTLIPKTVKAACPMLESS